MALAVTKTRRIHVDDVEYAWAVSINKGRTLLLLQRGDGRGRKIEFRLGYAGRKPLGIDARGLARVDRADVDAAFVRGILRQRIGKGGSIEEGWRGSLRFVLREGRLERVP